MTDMSLIQYPEYAMSRQCSIYRIPEIDMLTYTVVFWAKWNYEVSFGNCKNVQSRAWGDFEIVIACDWAYLHVIRNPCCFFRSRMNVVNRPTWRSKHHFADSRLSEALESDMANPLLLYSWVRLSNFCVSHCGLAGQKDKEQIPELKLQFISLSSRSKWYCNCT